jgi:hypothetical protein
MASIRKGGIYLVNFDRVRLQAGAASADPGRRLNLTRPACPASVFRFFMIHLIKVVLMMAIVLMVIVIMMVLPD